MKYVVFPEMKNLILFWDPFDYVLYYNSFIYSCFKNK